MLHLSKREGLPVAVMESLSEGLPVICYDIRGNNDLVIDQNNGFFIKSYKEVVGIISYLNLEVNSFNQYRFNAFKSINNSFSKKRINKQLHNIIKNYYTRHDKVKNKFLD